MPKRIIVLLVATLVSAVVVVELRHDNRLKFARLQALQHDRDLLNTEWEKLLLEEATWSQHRRIETLARTRLGMDVPSREHIVVVPATGAAPP